MWGILDYLDTLPPHQVVAVGIGAVAMALAAVVLISYFLRRRQDEPY